MKILFISNLFPPNAVGGYERLCAHVANNFSKNHKVIVLTSNFGDALPDNRESVVVYRTLNLLIGKDSIYEPFSGTSEDREKKNKLNISELKKVLGEDKPDIVFVWNLYFLDRSFLDELEKINNRVVYFLTDNWLISFLKPDYLDNYFAELYKKNGNIFLWVKSLIRKIIHIQKENNSINYKLKSESIFSSKFMHKLYLSAGIEFDKSSIIYNGVDLNESINCEINRNFNSKGEIKILFAGRLVHIKGVHILIEAFSKLIQDSKFNNTSLTIIGDSEDSKYIKSLHESIDKYGIRNKVIFKNFIKENELFNEFQNYDIYIFPSLYEPFSLTLIHALASGIPTISSNAGGNPEIVIDQEIGLVYDKFSSSQLAQKIKFFIENPEMRSKISSAGRKKAREFEFNDMCKKMSNYFS